MSAAPPAGLGQVAMAAGLECASPHGLVVALAPYGDGANLDFNLPRLATP